MSVGSVSVLVKLHNRDFDAPLIDQPSSTGPAAATLHAMRQVGRRETSDGEAL